MLADGVVASIIQKYEITEKLPVPQPIRKKNILSQILNQWIFAKCSVSILSRKSSGYDAVTVKMNKKGNLLDIPMYHRLDELKKQSTIKEDSFQDDVYFHVFCLILPMTLGYIFGDDALSVASSRW